MQQRAAVVRKLFLPALFVNYGYVYVVTDFILFLCFFFWCELCTELLLLFFNVSCIFVLRCVACRYFISTWFSWLNLNFSKNNYDKIK